MQSVREDVAEDIPKMEVQLEAVNKALEKNLLLRLKIGASSILIITIPCRKNSDILRV